MGSTITPEKPCAWREVCASLGRHAPSRRLPSFVSAFCATLLVVSCQRLVSLQRALRNALGLSSSVAEGPVTLLPGPIARMHAVKQSRLQAGGSNSCLPKVFKTC